MITMKQLRDKQGFSVVEVLLASSLFVVFSTGIVITLLQGLSMNRVSQEETIAAQYASEGVEAVRSIRNQNFALLSNSSETGVDRVGGLWSFSGTNNVLDGKYVRVITVSPAQRNAGGDIVENGGVLDTGTKKITVSVSWQAASAPHSVALTTYVTRWK